MSEDLYREIILDYYKNPRNYGALPDPDSQARDTNPLCGDEVEMHLKFDGTGKIKDIRFRGQGCAISQASASLLTELVKGRDLEEARTYTKEKLLEGLGLPQLGPVRIKCALLPLKVLKLAVYGYLGKKPEGPLEDT